MATAEEQPAAAVIAHLFESYEAACRTGADAVDDGGDTAFEVRAAKQRWRWFASGLPP